MKKRVLFLAAIMVALFSFTTIDAMAQGGGGGGRGGMGGGPQQGGQQRQQMNLDPEKLAKSKVEDLTKVLELTEDQATQMYTIYLDLATRNIEAMKEKMASGERPQQQEQQRPEQQEGEEGERPQRPTIFTQTDEYEILATETAVKKFLSDEQFTAWQKIKYTMPVPAEDDKESKREKRKKNKED